MKLVELNAPTSVREKEVQAGIVLMLEQWLNDARAGKYDALAICAVLKDGSTDSEVPKHNQHPALIGAVGVLHHRLIGDS